MDQVNLLLETTSNAQILYREDDDTFDFVKDREKEPEDTTSVDPKSDGVLFSPNETEDDDGNLIKYPFKVCGRCICSSRTMIFFVSMLSVVAVVGQQITLPLFLSTFNSPGYYFVLVFCSLAFTFIFSVGSILLFCNKSITDDMRQWRWHRYMMLVGVCDAVNVLLLVYSSELSRTSGPTQALLGQSIFPFMAIFSKWILKKQYNRKQMVGWVIILCGAYLSLIPMWLRVRSDSEDGKTVNWWWPLVFVFAQIPGALMDVVQEKMQTAFTDESNGTNRRFSVVYFQAWESFYQLLSILVLCWVDIIPGFGSSLDFDVLRRNFRFGFDCFFMSQETIGQSDRCVNGFCLGLGLAFIAFVAISYAAGNVITNYASANYLSIIQGLSPLLVVLFWYLFPSINSWGQGTNYSLTSVDALFNLAAIPITLIGIYLFRNNESEPRYPHEDELSRGRIEICCI